MRDQKLIRPVLLALAICAVPTVTFAVEKQVPQQPAPATVRPAPRIVTPDVVRVPTCRDIQVEPLAVSLASSTAGTPGLEFPVDRLRIEANLVNSGPAQVPAGGRTLVVLQRDGQAVIGAIDLTQYLSASGSRHHLSLEDEVPHGSAAQYKYRLEVTTEGFADCNAANNVATATVTEGALHPGGRPDLRIGQFSCVRGSRTGSAAAFKCQVEVVNAGDGVAGAGTSLEIHRVDPDVALRSMTIAQLALPIAGANKTFVVNLRAADIPKGIYAVYALLQPVPGEADAGNNRSTVTAEIRNQPLTLTAQPAQATPGTNVTLTWDVQSPNAGAALQYEGFYSGTIRNLASTGQRVVCPYGVTEYTLTHPAYPGQQAQVTTGSDCPVFTLTDEWLVVLNPLLTASIQEKYPQIAIDPGGVTLKIKSTGIVVDIKGAYHKEHLQPIDIRVHALALPTTPQGPIQVELKDFDVSIGSTETRVAWDILTLGLYEGIKKGLEDYFEDEYRESMRSQIESELRSSITWAHDDVGFVRLHDGGMDINKCRMCYYPSVSGTE